MSGSSAGPGHRADSKRPTPSTSGDGSRRGSALRSARLLVVVLVQLSGSLAAATARRPTRSGSGAPGRLAARRRPHVARADGPVFMLDGFDAGAELGAALGSGVRDVHRGAVRPEPVLLRPHPARRRPDAHRRRPHQRERQASPTRRSSTRRRGTYFRGPDMSVGRWYPTATELPDGRVLTSRATTSSRTGPAPTAPFSDASVDSLPSIYNPKTNTWTDLRARGSPRRSTRSCSSSPTAASSTPARTR